MANNGLSTLTAEDVLAIYASEGSHPEIAREFGISRPAVSHIKRGYTWAHVTGHTPNRTYAKA